MIFNTQIDLTILPTLQALGSITNGQVTNNALLAASFSKLTPAKIADIATTRNLNLEQLTLALSTTTLSEAEQDETINLYKDIMAKKQSAAATTAQATATGAATVATGGFSAALKGLGAVMAAHPIMAIFTALTIIVPIVTSLWDKFNTTLEEQHEKTQQLESDYEQLTSSISSLKDELTQTKDRIKELQSMDSLTFTEQEELENLQKQNKFIESQIELLRKKKEVEAQEVNAALQEEYKKDFQDNGERESRELPPTADLNGQGLYLAQRVNEDTFYQEQLRYYQELMEKRENYANLSEEEQESVNKQLEETETYLVDAANRYMELASRVIVVDEDSQNLKDTWSDLAQQALDLINGITWSSDITERLDEVLSLDEFSDVKKELKELGSQGKITANLLNSSAYSAFINKLKEVGILGEESGVTMADLASHLNAIALNAEDAGEAFEDVLPFNELIEGLSDLKSGFDSLSSALGEFKDNKIVAADTFAKLQEDFGELEGLQDFTNVLGNSASTMEEVQEACNSLAREYLDQINILEGLTDETSALVIAQLESIGVTNAAEVVTSKLAIKNAEAIIATEGMTNATWDEVEALLREKGATDDAIVGLQALRIEQYNAQIASIDYADASIAVIQSLIQQGEEAGVAAEKISYLRQVLAFKTTSASGLLPSPFRMAFDSAANFYWENAKEDPPDYNPPAPQISIPLPKSSKRSSGGSKKTTELYKAEIDRLFESSQRLKDIQDEIDLLEAKSSTLDESEYEKKNEYLERTIDLLGDENAVLNEQNKIRRQMIQEGVDKLKGYGFDVSYDAASNDLLIKGMERINELYASDGKVESTNELRKSVESLIKDIQSWNDEAVDASRNWHDNLAKMIEDTKLLAENIKVAADEWTNDQEHNIKLMEHMGNRQDKIAATYMKMMNYVHDKAEEIRALMRANGKSEEEIANSDEIQDLQNAWWDYYDALKAVREEQIDYLNDIVELTKDMIKQEKEDLIDALEAQKDEYKEIIELKKASIQLTERERTYNQKKKDYADELKKLKLRADLLRLDDSREAQLELGSVMEEISDKQRELDDLQHEHSIDNQEDALDKELEMFEKAQDEKINEIKAFLNNNQALTEAAMDRIDSEGAALFDDLLKYALHYTDTTEEELTKMWDNAMAAAQRYGSFVEAMGAYKAQLDVFENGANATDKNKENVISQMQSNSQAWNEAHASGDSDKMDQLQNETQTLGNALGANRDQFGYWWKDGKLLYGTDYYTPAQIVALMKRYSAAWNSASSKTEQQQYADRASYLGTSLGANRDKNGVWWLDGQKLYDKKFHEGGIVGPHPTKDQTETMILARNGEAVLTEPMQKNMKNAFKSVQMMREQAFNLPDIHKFMENLRAGWNSLAGNIPNESFSKKQEQLPPINVESSITINGQVDDHIKELLENHAYDIADIVARKILLM